MPSDEAVRSHRESVRRARRVVEELVHDYDLRWMITLTYAVEPKNHREVYGDLPGFSRRLRSAGLTLPRLIVPEHDPTTRWHLHLAMPTSPAPALAVLSELWAHGDVHGPDPERATSEGALDGLSRYLTKGFNTTPAGARRYVTSAGLRPLDHRFTVPNAHEALQVARRQFGADPVHSDWYAGNFMAFFNPIKPLAAA